jgi:hypothetical protein
VTSSDAVPSRALGSLRAAIVGVMAIALLVLGLSAAHHSESTPSPSANAASWAQTADAAPEAAQASSDTALSTALAGGCLLLAICCAIGLAVRGITALSRPLTSMSERVRWAPPSRGAGTRPGVSLQILSISRT